MADATPNAFVCCLALLLTLYCTRPVSGAWIWDLGVPKSNNSSVATPTSETAASNSTAAIGPTNTAKSTPGAIGAPSNQRLRSGKSAKAGSRIVTKKQPQNATTFQPSTKDSRTSTTQPPPVTKPSVSFEMEPKILKTIEADVPVNPVQNPSPIVIVEPDSYGNGGYNPAGYYQPYGAMSLPPSPYVPPPPYPQPVPYSPISPPPPLLPYIPPYSQYPMGGFAHYQLPMEAAYNRPHRSAHFPYFPPVGVYPFSGYPEPYTPFVNSWWRPYVPELVEVRTVNSVGCTSEGKRDREELAADKNDETRESKEPSPTYVSLLPSVPVAVPGPEVTKKDAKKKISAPEQSAESERIKLTNNAYGATAKVGVQEYNPYGSYGTNNNVDREKHILRNNPFQQSASWPGYYSQPQWPHWSPWQQWTAPQQPQQQSQQYSYGISTQPPQRQHQQQYGFATQHPAGQHLHKRQAGDPHKRRRHYA